MNWFAKRIGMAILTIWGVITISFGLVRLMPGGPSEYIMAQMLESAEQGGTVDMSAVAARAEAFIEFNPEEPIYIQYFDYMTSILTGSLGTSTWYQEPVEDIIIRALPWTVFIMGIATILSFVFGILLGALMAYLEGSSFDFGASVLSIITNSTPYYLFAIILVIIFAYEVPLFPAGGKFNPSLEPHTLAWYGSVAYHAILPVVSMVITIAGGVALSMRGNSIQVLGEDHLRVARLRGLTPGRIASTYVARNAVLPLYTGMMIAIGNIFGGSVIVEVIFDYEGIGYYMYEAVLARDYPLLMGTFIVITIAVVISLFIADLTYGLLDPRVSSGGANNE